MTDVEVTLTVHTDDRKPDRIEVKANGDLLNVDAAQRLEHLGFGVYAPMTEAELRELWGNR